MNHNVVIRKSTITILYILLTLSIYSCMGRSGVSSENIDKTNHDSTTVEYSSSTLDPDTSLAIFLWNDTIPEFDNSIEEYTRLALEKREIMALIESLYKHHPVYKERVKNIEARAVQFDRHIKDLLFKEGARDRSLSDSRELWYIQQTDKKLYDSLIKLYPIYR